LPRATCPELAPAPLLPPTITCGRSHKSSSDNHPLRRQRQPRSLCGSHCWLRRRPPLPAPPPACQRRWPLCATWRPSRSWGWRLPQVRLGVRVTQSEARGASGTLILDHAGSAGSKKKRRPQIALIDIASCWTPSAGAALYGYAALPLQYAAQHLAPAGGRRWPAAGQPAPWPVWPCAGCFPDCSPRGDILSAESPTQAAAFSPFAGGAEPGSEPSPREAGRLGLSLSNGESTHPEALVEDGARAPVSPAAPPSPAASDPGAPGWVGHTSLQELRSAGAPRTATLPRPISADNLGRVASLRAGIPRIRTRQKVPWGGLGVADCAQHVGSMPAELLSHASKLRKLPCLHPTWHSWSLWRRRAWMRRGSAS
jgi:hypothetical protein